MNQRPYLHIGQSANLENPKERRIYRFLETIPEILWIKILSYN